MLDINTCTLQQLKGVQGIDEKLAENFVKYRRLHGRFRSFDEIWRVPGMNRSTVQLLAKHFRISIPKPVILNAKTPQARLSLTESMIDFVCKGQSVTGSGHDMRTPEAVPSGTTRNGTRYHIPSKDDKATHSKDDLPMRVKITKKSSSNIGNGKKNSSREKVNGRPAQKSAPIEREISKSQTEARHKSANPFASNKYKIAKGNQPDQQESQAILDGTNLEEQDPGSQNQPAITLVTTPSGNNINFSCTIDKRFLKHPTSMAFHFDEQGGANGMSSPENVVKPIQNSEIPDVSASAINNKTLWQIPGSPTKQHGEISEVKTGLNDSTCTSASSPLSQENVFLFERQHTQSPVEKKSAIEAWVVEVNVSRDLEATYKRKRSAQRKSGGAWSPNSKKTLSPPPKKLLRRPVLEQNFSSPNTRTYYGKPRINETVVKVKTYGGKRNAVKASDMSSPSRDKPHGTPMTTPGNGKERDSDYSSDAGVPAKALHDAQRAASIRKHIRQVEQPGRSRYGQGTLSRNNKVKVTSDLHSGKKSETQAVKVMVGPSTSDSPGEFTPRDLIKSKQKQSAIKSQANEEEVCAVM